MPKSIVDFDFSDVDAAISGFISDVISKEDAVGREAVDYAVGNGTYSDRTGRLRRSNRYRADESGLELFNDAGYAPDVEARGHDVLGGAALLAEKRLREIFGK